MQHALSGFFTLGAISNLLVLSGVLTAVAIAADQLFRGDRAWSRIPVAGSARWTLLLAPPALVCLGFYLSGAVSTLWTAVVGAAVLAACWLGCHGLRAVHLARRDELVAGPAAAILVLVLVLLELGLLLSIRLALIPSPASAFAPGLTDNVLTSAKKTLGLPLGGLLVLLGAGLGAALLARRRAAVERARPAAGEGARPATGERARWAAAGAWAGRHPRWVGLGLGALVIVPFLLPVLSSGAAAESGDSEGSDHLVFLGVATPEYGKVAFLVVLAIVAGRYSIEAVIFRRNGFRGAIRGLAAGLRSRPRHAIGVFVQQTRFLLYPMALIGGVAVSSAIRHDFGTMVPVLAAALGVIWAAISIEVRTAPVAATTRRRGFPAFGRSLLRYLRPYALIAAGLLLVAVLVAPFTDYARERYRIWKDPWQFRWNADCQQLPDGGAALRPPKGTEVCERLGILDLESERSQLAHALAAIQDGGLWGRGLHDVLLPRLPVASSDFVIAAAWNKLGGLTVLGCAAAIALLGIALVRLPAALAARSDELPGPANGGAARRFQGVRRRMTVAALLGAGAATLIVGQFFFVFAANLGVVPHSGITAPFLSRGPQATVALLLVLAAVVATGYGGTHRATVAAARAARAPGQPLGATARPARSRQLAPPAQLLVGLSLPACLLLGIAITAVPYRAPLGATPFASYREDRPTCGSSGTPEHGDGGPEVKPIRPAECSTDLIAHNRPRLALDIGSQQTFRLDRSAGSWTTDCRAGALTTTDLGGLISVDGGPQGLLDVAYPDVVGAGVPTGSDLTRRLLPPRGGTDPDAGLTIGIDPALQRRLAAALTRPGPAGAPPLAGGLVVLDAGTGRITAMASAPTRPASGTACAAATDTSTAPLSERPDVREWYEADRAGTVGTDGKLTVRPGATCGIGERDTETRRRCGSYELRETRTATAGQAGRELADGLRYVGNDPAIPAEQFPAATVNRAVGKRYGLGSVFKVVVAAAWLARPGASADDRFDAPTSVETSGGPIRNFGDGGCPGTAADGTISLAKALAVSCNTAFVSIGDELGWPAIRAMAEKLGLTVAGPTTSDKAPQPFADRAFGADTRVPVSPAKSGLGRNVIGEGEVGGTPVGMATVMATIANDGVPVAPRLATALTGSGRTRTIGPVRRDRALTPAQAAELRRALSGTVVEGTARGLSSREGHRLWVKTGTHEVYPAGTCPADVFLCDVSWLVGIVDTAAGRVAFAVAVETRDEQAGGARARWLAQAIVDGIG